MDVREHPEHGLYQQDAALVEDCRQAIAAWLAAGEPIVADDGVTWTPERARDLVQAVAQLFRQYNLVLWQSFSYCRRCQGGCCVTGASQVTVFDALALALLEQPFPELAARAAPGDCIYLGAGGCRWPQQWRPIKCWAFYCLGSGDWEIDAGDARYARITEALRATIQEYLPGYLQGHVAGLEAPLEQFLADPIAFADALGSALFRIFVEPFRSTYDLATSDSLRANMEDGHMASTPAVEQALTFIAGAVQTSWEQADLNIPVSSRFLEDLEHLEWLLLQRPPGARDALQEMLARYAGRNEQMAIILRQLLRDRAIAGHPR